MLHQVGILGDEQVDNSVVAMAPASLPELVSYVDFMLLLSLVLITKCTVVLDCCITQSHDISSPVVDTSF